MADGWQCGLFWALFALTVLLPMLTEAMLVARLLFQLFSPSSSSSSGHRLKQQQQQQRQEQT